MAGETLNCPGVETVNNTNIVIADKGTQAIETVEQDGKILAFCPAFESGSCRRAKKLSPDDPTKQIAVSPLCLLDSMGRMLYPDLGVMAAAVVPDADELSRITMVRSRDQVSAQPIVPVAKPEVKSSFSLPTAVIDRRSQPDAISVRVFPAEPVDAEAVKELAGALIVEKDVDFMPFASATAFLATEDEIADAYTNEAEDDAIPVLLSRTINYAGIKGTIGVISDIPEYENVENYYSDVAKPMGAVRWTAESENGNTTYVALPVRLRVSFSTKKFTQYMTLQQSLLELSFADGSKYYLSCSKDPDDIEYNREDFKNLGKGQKMTFTADETIDIDGDEDVISLPMDLATLRGLTMKFVDNPNFEEEDTDEDNS